ncbi:hypothetical protein BaRGS_00036493 [Batillaria attramentaria]|uniref:Secreted protein n=1 Tax=Batillaria attramentaria TaxID=370345 RepID=A0ABD0JBU0_9CAEN
MPGHGYSGMAGGVNMVRGVWPLSPLSLFVLYPAISGAALARRSAHATSAGVSTLETPLVSLRSSDIIHGRTLRSEQ